MNSPTSEYDAFVHGAALQARPDYGVLTLSDADRVDFLQRITTNDIARLPAGRSAVTVLTSPTARVLFVFTVLRAGDRLWLLPAAGQAAALERHLAGQIFFMDKVKVRNLSAEYGRLRLMGPQANVVLAAAGIPAEALDDEAWCEHDGVILARQQGYDIPGVEIVAPLSRLDALQTRLIAAGARLCADEATYTARRVELGRPLAGAELTADYNPLEAGLAWACAENKGCYTGQEIIARQITYDKTTKTLVSLRSTQQLTSGDILTADGREVGRVTSAAFSPALGASLALGIVKRPHNQPGAALDTNGQAVIVAEAGES